MLRNRLAVFFALALVLIGSAKALDGFEFPYGILEGEEECLQKNNISPEDKLNITELGYLESVELKYKCHAKCLMDKQLEKFNLTTEAGKDFIKCMDQADEEPCSYAFQLLYCTAETFAPDYFSEEYEEYSETSSEEEL